MADLSESVTKLQQLLDGLEHGLKNIGLLTSALSLTKDFPIGTMLYLQRNALFPEINLDEPQEVILMGTAVEVVNHEILDDTSFLHLLMPVGKGLHAIYRQNLRSIEGIWDSKPPVSFAQHLDVPIP